MVQMSVHLSSTLLEVTIGFLQHVLSKELSLDVLKLLGSSFLFSTLLPTTLAQLGPIACKQPKVSVCSPASTLFSQCHLELISPLHQHPELDIQQEDVHQLLEGQFFEPEIFFEYATGSY